MRTVLNTGTSWATLSERASLYLLVGILTWVQFPLGSNRPWSWSLLAILIAIDWAFWIPAGVGDLRKMLVAAKRVATSGALFLMVLIWIWLQSVDITPLALHNPVWQIAEHGLGQHVPSAISINPFATMTELMKLASYLVIGWLSFVLSLRLENARLLFLATFVVGVMYAAYGIALSALGTSQLTLLEGLSPPYGRDVSGGFVAKNSFATFTGISLLAGLALLVDASQHEIVTKRDWRTHVRTLIQFVLGRGSPWLVGSLILLAALIASDSRAGLIATFFGLLTVFGLALIISARKGDLRWGLAGGCAAAAAMVALFLVNGHNLQSRFENLIETAGSSEMRPAMWGVAIRAISDHPMMGTGLGTYEDAYPMYANRFVPYVVDRVHNDYLEFCLGVGIPAAIAWLVGLLALAYQCVYGALTRNRRRMYSITALGALSLVGFHSLFDFSLQMPAVSVLFSIIIGVGLGQARSSYKHQPERSVAPRADAPY